MKKIISLFQRNYDGDRLVRDEVVPGAEWVVAGEGVPTRKFDGTCCMVRSGKFYKRYDAKKGKRPPADFEAAQDYDEVTGHMPGWVPVGEGPDERWHREAFAAWADAPDGTYELCGPKIQGNPEGYQSHQLMRRNAAQMVADLNAAFAERNRLASNTNWCPLPARPAAPGEEMRSCSTT